ncbi:hypothetical protein L6452_13908 [Arctium lappa]|uniref:Uncharacterized protein n=1 Tax=Arctium lappa TaxID=4217 RepID=A0ACB9CJJ6_ARCLA|nr:hypothetical protein L6452_13908 [Arctium lappa]
MLVEEVGMGEDDGEEERGNGWWFKVVGIKSRQLLKMGGGGGLHSNHGGGRKAYEKAEVVVEGFSVPTIDEGHGGSRSGDKDVHQERGQKRKRYDGWSLI